MSFLTSPHRGLSRAGWRLFPLTGLGICLIPAAIGLAAAGGLRLLGTVIPAQGLGLWQDLAFLLAISPLLTLPILLLISVCAAIFMQFGQYGSLTTLSLGLFCGALSAQQTGLTILVPYAVLAAVLQRLLIGLYRPAAL